MVVTVRNKINTSPNIFTGTPQSSAFTSQTSSSVSKSSDSKVTLSSELISYIESGMLIALVASLLLCRYVPFLSESSVANMYLQIYTAFFVTVESFFKAYQLIDTYNENGEKVWETSTWKRSLAYLLAFGIAIVGLLPLSVKNTATFGQLVSALALAVFPYNLSDLFISQKCSFTDMVYNGMYGVLLASGILSWYLDYNYLGLFALVAIALKGVQTFMANKNTSRMLVGKQALVVMGFAALSVAMVVLCYYKKLTMGMPEFADFFKKMHVHES